MSALTSHHPNLAYGIPVTRSAASLPDLTSSRTATSGTIATPQADLDKSLDDFDAAQFHRYLRVKPCFGEHPIHQSSACAAPFKHQHRAVAQRAQIHRLRMGQRMRRTANGDVFSDEERPGPHSGFGYRQRGSPKSTAPSRTSLTTSGDIRSVRRISIPGYACRNAFTAGGST